MSDDLTLFDLPEYSQSPEINEKSLGKARINTPFRNQVEYINFCLEDLIPSDHKVRFVWDYVQKLDMSGFITKIQSVEGNPGRPAIDPRFLL